MIPKVRLRSYNYDGSDYVMANLQEDGLGVVLREPGGIAWTLTARTDPDGVPVAVQYWD